MLPNHCSHAHARINRPRNRRCSKLTASLALLALALLAAPHAARAQVQPQGAGVAIPSAASELKVMTWNIRGGLVRPGDEGPKRCRPNLSPAYLNGIASEIEDHAALDVVALQEVYRSQADKLRGKLEGYLGPNPRLYFAATINCDLIGDEYGLAIISRYPFPEDSKERVRICRTLFGGPFSLDVPRCPGNEQRVLARVIIRVDGHPIHIYNTHLAPASHAHNDMAKLIIKQVVKDKPDRAVLLGDFYFHDRSVAHREIRREFRDAWKGASDDERKDCSGGEGFTHKTLNPTQRDDYVFISYDGFRVDGARVTCEGDLREMFGLPRKGPSRDGEPLFTRVPDHLPLTVRLALVE